MITPAKTNFLQQSEDYSHTLLKNNADINDLRSRLEVSEIGRNQLKNQLMLLNQEMNAKNLQYKNHFDNLNNIIMMKEKEIENLKLQSESNSTQLCSLLPLTSKHALLQSSYQELLSKFELLQASSLTFQTKEKQFLSQNELLEGEIVKLRGQLMKEKEIKSELEGKIKHLELNALDLHRLPSLLSSIVLLRTEIERLHSIISSKNEESKLLSKSCKILAVEREKLKSKVATLDRQFEGIEREFEKLARKNIVKLGERREGEDFYSEIDGLKEKVSSKRREMESILKDGESGRKKRSLFDD